MAPDSSLSRHHLGEWAGNRQLLKAAGLCLLSLFFFAIPAQAKTEIAETPELLASLSPPYEGLKKEVPGSTTTLPTLADTLPGTPTVLGRNRIQIPIDEPLIQRYIRFYQGEGRKTFSVALERAKTCLPQMMEILESHGVPGELVSIVFIESQFEKHAFYRGAGGYWQLMAGTARNMGLRVNRWMDERRDPIKSTKAAATYLRQLYERYDSWLLALAAYNAGGVPVSCAVSNRRTKDGELRGHKLPARCRTYVSKVLAAMQVLREPEQYGFESPQYCKPKDFDPIMVKSPLELKLIAKWIDVPVNQLQDLNPSLRLNALPPDSGFSLRLPSGSRDKFELAFDEHKRR